MGMQIVIIGSGPAGLAAAIALSKLSQEADSPTLSITLVELRPKLETIGGTLNVTPLAVRYLEYLGAAERVRARAINLDSGLDYVALRTGQHLGNIWGGIGALRVIRHAIVESLLQTLTEDHPNVNVLWSKRMTEIAESNDHVTLKFDDDSTLQADLVLGCEGIHSATRRLYVDSQRKPYFTGRVLAMGWADCADSKKPPMVLPNGEPALRDTLLLSSQNGVLLTSYYEPSRTKVYFANIMYMDEPKDQDVRNGWRLRGNDSDAMKRDVLESYQGGKVKGVQELLAKCDDWHLYPSYVLPREGDWSRGRVLLLGDAAHAMPPAGESTGLALEDGVLIAHVLRGRWSRSIERLIEDFVTVRRPVIEKYHKDAVWAMTHGFVKRSWLMSIVMEWGIWLFLMIKRWQQVNHFARDVRDIELPE